MEVLITPGSRSVSCKTNENHLTAQKYVEKKHRPLTVFSDTKLAASGGPATAKVIGKAVCGAVWVAVGPKK